MQNNKILVTGSTGFIGNALLQELSLRQYPLIAPVRSSAVSQLPSVEQPVIGDLSELAGKGYLSDCDVVIHTAAIAHTNGVSLDEFIRVNTDATLTLAESCVKSGVRRFIFLSSIGVNGICSYTPFNIDDTPAPAEDYAISKFKAETGLKKIVQNSAMELVIIRPPLVYGAAARGNFGKLAKLAQKNLPLPLGAIHNKRSLVALDNLVDLIVTCIDHPKAANQTFMVSDGQDVSTTELLKLMTRAAGKTPWLIPVPISWLKLAGKLTGKQAVIDRLCGNLQLDISHTQHTLGWTPPLTLEQGIARCFSR
ncbi:UDP-glucose 4-epimerase family protein [Rheinheimera pleomorphica]|uniref:UDP-glucose 4-epimerase family protein n=1 Tax=Rheinheimera pleomorphica TaxID=2703963 RepID=UPI001420C310|nr:SDR family oxidoreductase [Rheinheimera pleomorphica]